MSYLARLKNLDSEKRPSGELPKLPKPPFDSFGSTEEPSKNPFGSFGSTEGERFLKTHDYAPAANDAVTAITSRWWRLHLADGGTLEVACNPQANRAEVQKRYHDALAAEPFIPTVRQPSTPMTAGEEAVIRAWLKRIGEDDPETASAVIDQCQRDEDARAYFLNQGRIH